MTTTWIALLRGMNVGGHRITNAELQRVFGELGFAGVTTYRASGNVIFDSDIDAEGLVSRVEDGLEAALGYAVPTFLRDATELMAVAAVRPFSEQELAGSRGKPQVTFLAKAPDATSREAVLALATIEDRLVLRGRELYWLPSAGILQTDLDLRGIDRLLGTGTMRTLGTIAGIAGKLAARE